MAQPDLIVINRFVPHTSTVPANKGQRVGIYLHEKFSSETGARFRTGGELKGRVVLFVHGNSVPSVPDFDLPFKNYSWMAYLAEAGFDTFSMDHTGYGFSPRPEMDNPCNLDENNQAILIPQLISEKCQPDYPHILSNSESDWDEIKTVVDFIRDLRGVDRVSLVGWSMGGPRAGGFAARYPEKIDKLVLYAPAYETSQPSTSAPVNLPGDVPMTLQTKQALMQDRWNNSVKCQDQIDPGIQDIIWQNIMGFDSSGSVWTREGVMRVRIGEYRGWNRMYAGKVVAPTLILVGENDFLLPAATELYPDLIASNRKVLVKMECATHFAVWEETQYEFMHEASKEWLLYGSFRKNSEGVFRQPRKQ